jgi:hypothetical protein
MAYIAGGTLKAACLLTDVAGPPDLVASVGFPSAGLLGS